MSNVRDDIDPTTEWTPDRIAELKCVDRGEGMKPMHIYLDNSGECQCKRGPNLSEQRMK